MRLFFLVSEATEQEEEQEEEGEEEEGEEEEEEEKEEACWNTRVLGYFFNI
jgi:hypothetical protein